MKKKLFILAAALFAALMLPMLFSCGDEFDQLKDEVTVYKMELIYNDFNKTLSGKNTVDYHNSADVPLESLSFMLHANAYRRDAQFRPVSSMHYVKAYPSGLSYGGIEVSKVEIGGKAAEFETGGDDLNVLSVRLPEKLYPGDRVEIYMEYTIKLANIRHRLGYAEDTVNLGNFFPVAAIYESGSFKTYPYYSAGDPFYTESSNFEVTLTAPKSFTVAATGEILSQTEQGDNKVTKISAQVVRDFAMVLSEKFEVIETEAEGTRILYYHYRDDGAQENLNAAADAVKTFNRLFGEYRYPTLSVVKCDFVFGGMEYPQLVYISDTLSKLVFTEVIVHEIAHQWWYAMVGSNQVEHAWLDEALADFSTALFYHENPKYGVTLDEYVESCAQSFRTFTTVYKQVLGEVDTSMNRPLGGYLTELEYTAVVYSRGTVMLSQARTSMGSEKFLKGLQKYFERNCFKIASPAEFFGCMDSAARAKVSALMESFINGEAVI